MKRANPEAAPATDGQLTASFPESMEEAIRVHRVETDGRTEKPDGTDCRHEGTSGLQDAEHYADRRVANYATGYESWYDLMPMRVRLLGDFSSIAFFWVGLVVLLVAAEARSDDGRQTAAFDVSVAESSTAIGIVERRVVLKRLEAENRASPARSPAPPDPAQARDLADRVDGADLETHPSLEAVQSYAVQHNPAIKTADYNWQAAQQRITQARSYKNPMITYIPDTGSNSQTRAGQVGDTVVLSQALPFPGKLTLQGKIAREQAGAAQQGVEAAVDEVSSQARRAYAEYYLAFRSLDTNAETMELAREFLALAQTKYSVGTTAQQDVILAQERLSRLATERVVFEGAREKALGALNAVLDRAPRAPVGIPESLYARELTMPLDHLVNSAEESRPELRAQKYIVEARKRAVTLAKMGYLPDFEVGAQHSAVAGGTNPGFAKDGDDIWTARLGLSIPLWTNRIGAEVAEAEARLMQEQSKYRDFRNAVFDQVQASYERVQIAARNESIYRTTLIPQTRERIAAARAGYETGVVDFLTLIDSLNSLEEVLLKRYRAVRDYHQALADVERAIGRLISEVH